MAASSKKYSNLHFHYLLGGGCGGCELFKRSGGAADALKSGLADTGIEIDETHAVHYSRGLAGGIEGRLQRKFILNCDGIWFPNMFVIRKDVYDKADSLPLNDVLKTVMIFNGKILFDRKPPTPILFNGRHGRPNPIYKTSLDDVKRFLDDYLKSEEYRNGDKLVGKFSSSIPSIAPAPSPSLPVSSPVVLTSPSTSSSSSSRPYVDLSKVAPMSSSNSMYSSSGSVKTCTSGSRRIMPLYK